MELDEINCKILNLLQKDCRISLTDVSKVVKLSVDSVKKRINKMIKEDIFFPKIQLRPRNFGFTNVVDVKIKLHNYTQKDIDQFVEYLKNNPFVAEVFSVSGEWDFSIVIIAKNPRDLGILNNEVRNRFSRIIKDWSESLTTCAFKFENYDMLKVMGYAK